MGAVERQAIRALPEHPWSRLTVQSPAPAADDFPRRIDEPSRQLAATPSPARAAHLRGPGPGAVTLLSRVHLPASRQRL